MPPPPMMPPRPAAKEAAVYADDFRRRAADAAPMRLSTALLRRAPRAERTSAELTPYESAATMTMPPCDLPSELSDTPPFTPPH